MNKKIKEAFDQIQMEDQLKDKTKAYISKKTRNYTKAKQFHFFGLISATICLLLLLIGGHWLYFTPTVAISVDINPSIELGINRFNQVVSIDSYNEDGKLLLDKLEIKYLNYQEAIDQIVNNDQVMAYLSNDEVMTICVIGDENKQSNQILTNIETVVENQSNTYCYHTNHHEVNRAHEVGLSYGKYQAYLQLQELDPTITVSDVQNMTMKEIHHLIESLTSSNQGNNYKNNEHGHRHGYHHEWGGSNKIEILF